MKNGTGPCYIFGHQSNLKQNDRSLIMETVMQVYEITFNVESSCELIQKTPANLTSLAVGAFHIVPMLPTQNEWGIEALHHCLEG